MIKRILIGLIAGIVSGLFTAGGGLIVVPLLLYTVKLESRKARATSIFCILPMTIVTSFFYGRNNLINWNVGIKCAVGGILGGLIGAKMLQHIPEKYLKLAFTLFIIYAGINMICK